MNCFYRVVLIILISRFVPYRVCIFSLRIWAAVRLRLQASLHLRSHLAPYLVSERRSIAGYVTERTNETWCKANAIKLV